MSVRGSSEVECNVCSSSAQTLSVIEMTSRCRVKAMGCMFQCMHEPADDRDSVHSVHGTAVTLDESARLVLIGSTLSASRCCVASIGKGEVVGMRCEFTGGRRACMRVVEGSGTFEECIFKDGRIGLHVRFLIFHFCSV